MSFFLYFRSLKLSSLRIGCCCSCDDESKGREGEDYIGVWCGASLFVLDAKSAHMGIVGARCVDKDLVTATFWDATMRSGVGDSCDCIFVVLEHESSRPTSALVR